MLFKYKYSPDDVIVKVSKILEETKQYWQVLGTLNNETKEEEMTLAKISWIRLPDDHWSEAN